MELLPPLLFDGPEGLRVTASAEGSTMASHRPFWSTLLVTAENPDQLLVVDATKGEIVKEHETGGETPHIVRCSPDSKTAYVSNARSRTVARIDVASGTLFHVVAPEANDIFRGRRQLAASEVLPN